MALLEDDFHPCDDTLIHRCPCGLLRVEEHGADRWYEDVTDRMVKGQVTLGG